MNAGLTGDEGRKIKTTYLQMFARQSGSPV